MNGLKNKNVLITGSSSGIGASIAEKFAEQEANVGIHYCNNKEGAFILAEKLRKITKVKVYQLDFLSDNLDIIYKFVKDFGCIDVLVNNAGIMSPVSIFNMSIKDYDNTFKINSRAPFILSRDAYKYMKEKKFGRIINISSFVINYGRGRNDSIHYAASKATLEVLTIGLAKLGAKHNVLVNAIRPGIIKTRLQENRDNLQERIKMIPVQKIGKVEDISNFVIYLASEKGNFITGQIFSVTGGE